MWSRSLEQIDCARKYPDGYMYVQGVGSLAYILLSEPFSVEDGTLSSDLALRRKEILRRYAQRLSRPDAVVRLDKSI